MFSLKSSTITLPFPAAPVINDATMTNLLLSLPKKIGWEYLAMTVHYLLPLRRRSHFHEIGVTSLPNSGAVM